MTSAEPRPLVRDRVRHVLAVRRVHVARTERVAPAMVRVTFTGHELDGFAAPGPADHVKLFFPDPATGVLTAPTVVDGSPQRPESGIVISRDYTPLAFRADGADGPELDIDFVLHGDEGPASAWAASAQLGDVIAVAGPRGSHLPPAGVSSAILVADETALPAVRRWLDALDVPVVGLFSVDDPATNGYLPERSGHTLRWFTGPEREAERAAALRELPIADETLVFLGGEAGALIPLRRHLRRERGLEAPQVDAQGYWKRGVVNHDHHAPLDPSDPE